MNIEQQSQAIETIHSTLTNYVGQRLRVRADLGRSKVVENDGVLTQTHPRLFIMEVDCKRGRTSRQSYQYADVLTGSVELSQGGQLIIDKRDFLPTADEEDDFVPLTLPDEDGGETMIAL